MAHRNKRTYHYGAHKPLEEGSGPKIAYRERPLPPEYSLGDTHFDFSNKSAGENTWAGSVGGELVSVARQWPLLAVGASIALGFLATRAVSRLV